MNRATLAPEWSDDAFLGGRLTIRQGSKGHRAGTDAVLLAACVAADFGGHVIDAGAATGAVGLMIAQRAPRTHITLVEIDPVECQWASHNVTANGLAHRCVVIEADLLASEAEREKAGLVKGAANCVVSNPPFLNAAAARLSPDQNRARAHALPEDGLEHWCRSLTWLVASDAQLALIHRADALQDVLHALDGRFGALTIRPVQPHGHKPATRILITGRKGSRAKLSIMPPLVLHDANGQFTPEAADMHAGKA